MKWFDYTALTLVIIGALNWLLIGIFRFDLVAFLFGNLSWLSRIVYTLVGLCGLYLGAAAQRIPVVLDGVISCAAALLAVRLCPQSVHFMVAAHRSDEPASILLLDALGKRPFLTAGMHLGEGTGAAAGVALLDLALAPYREMVSFADIGMEAYQPQK